MSDDKFTWYKVISFDWASSNVFDDMVRARVKEGVEKARAAHAVLADPTAPKVESVIPSSGMSKEERRAARERIAPSPRVEEGEPAKVEEAKPVPPKMGGCQACGGRPALERIVGRRGIRPVWCDACYLKSERGTEPAIAERATTYAPGSGPDTIIRAWSHAASAPDLRRRRFVGK